MLAALPVLLGLAVDRAGAAPPTPPSESRRPAPPHLVLVHGDADWIRRGGYRDRDGDHCCGEEDCFRVAPAEVREVEGGFSLLGRFIARAEARPSEDDHYWACYSLFKFRCFFYPRPRF